MKSETLSRALPLISIVIVGAVVVWAFTLVGSPTFNRKLASDKNRIEHLGILVRGIEQFYEEQKELPNELNQLTKLKIWYGEKPSNLDPATGKAYEYRKIDSYTYEVCAEFELTSEQAEIDKSRYSARDDDVWKHVVGRHCFKHDIPPKKR